MKDQVVKPISQIVASQLLNHGSGVTLARERLLPVHPVLGPLFGFSADNTAPLALVRGQTVACTGTAAMSTALAVLAGPTQAGSWAAVVGLPSLGVQAAADLGVVLERTIFVADPVEIYQQEKRSDMAAVLSALVDGVDVLLLAQQLVQALSASLLRRLQTRVRSRGCVLVVVGQAHSFLSPASLSLTSVDTRLTATTQEWQGIGLGYGHLTRRRVLIELDGRRRARTVQQQVWLPDHRGQLSSAKTLVGTTATTNSDVVLPFCCTS